MYKQEVKKKPLKQWDTITHLLEWTKLKTLTTLNTVEEMEQQELPFITGGNAKWHSHFWKTVWLFLIKLNILLLYNPATMLLDIFYTVVHKKLYTSVYSSFIHNCQNLEVTKMSSVDECINYVWYIQTCNIIQC